MMNRRTGEPASRRKSKGSIRRTGVSASRRANAGRYAGSPVRRLADTAAVIVAGGQGLRFGGKTRKQYLLLKRQPLVWWSVRAFDQSPSVGAMVLVVPEKDVAPMRRQVRAWRLKKPIAVVAGGAERSDSVRFGLAAVPAGFQWIAVHDAVRPLVTVETIEKTIAVTRKTKAAIAACPSRDTVKLADANGRIDRTPPRNTVWLAQTPQIFERRLLERAHEHRAGAAATDDALMVERLGVRVHLVASPAENIKVTLPTDLEIARLILSHRNGSH